MLSTNFAKHQLEQMDMIALYGSAAFTQKTINKHDDNELTVKERDEASTQAMVTRRSGGRVAALPPPSSSMLDLLFVHPDPLAFHLSQLSIPNSSHYASLRHFKSWPGVLNAVQEYGAGVWYNTLVKLPFTLPNQTNDQSSSAVTSPPMQSSRMVKYGVISTKRLKQDLEQWDSLYIAGRMHKPMHLLTCSSSVSSAASSNLRSALRTALLLLDSQTPDAEAAAVTALHSRASTKLPHPSPYLLSDPSTSTSLMRFSLFSLFSRLVSLSYAGDIRMGLAENPHKVASIVHGSWNSIIPLYRKAMIEVLGEESRSAMRPDDVVEVYLDADHRAQLFAQLPFHLRREIILADTLAQQRAGGCSEILKEEEKIEAARTGLNPLSSNIAATSTTMGAFSSRAASSSSSSPSSFVRPYWHEFAHHPAPVRHAALTGALANIVRRSSRQQTLKGLATAGVRKSIRYIAAKVVKAIKK